MPRRRPSYSEFRSGLEKLRSYADTRELCHTVRFADVFSRPTVLVDGIDVEVAVRIPRIELFYGARNVDPPGGVEVRREAVMRYRNRRGKHESHHDCGRQWKHIS